MAPIGTPISWTWRPWHQTRALENARIASTELARRRVERQEVEIFLEGLAEARRERRRPA